MTIESEADRQSYLQEGETLAYGGNTVDCASAMADGQTLDGGREVDGVTDVFVTLTDLVTLGPPDNAVMSLNGVDYRLEKIDDIGNGMSRLLMIKVP